MLAGKKILLGVSGGIAAYKSPAICSLLRKKGAEVKVIMTEHAQEFITPLTLQTMSNHIVHDKMFEQLHNMEVEHIALAKWADIFVIAPTTANVMGKFAHGIADDMLTTVFMASRCPVMIAPAMNTVMLQSQANMSNMQLLEERGLTILPTQTDVLACGDEGSGKMLEPSDIVEYIDAALTPKDLCGKEIVVTSGPTIEPIDPVRYLTNHSTGKMGYAIAKCAKKRGAKVVLISGPTSIVPPKVDEFVRVGTTQEMFDAVGRYFSQCDVLIKAAAPADYRPKEYSEEKIKKTREEGFHAIELEKNPDIAKFYGEQKTHQVMVGFAAESIHVEEYAKKKLESKHFDFIVANNIKMEGAGFGTDTNIVKFIDREGVQTLPMMSKEELANKILDRVVTILS